MQPTIDRIIDYTLNLPEAEQVMDAVAQALQQANETGSATVGFRNGSVDQTGNESIETGYDITVVKFGGVSPAA